MHKESESSIHHSPFTIHHSSSSGFTLVETILYIALIVIMLSALVPFALQMIDSSAKSGTAQDVYSAARYASERIKYEIRNASDLNVANSSFGVNLATTTGAMLSLAESTSSVNPTNFSVVSGTLKIAQGANSPVALNPSSTQITSLVFQNYSTGTYHNIGFVLVVSDSSTSTRTEYQASTTIESSAELRSK